MTSHILKDAVLEFATKTTPQLTVIDKVRNSKSFLVGISFLLNLLLKQEVIDLNDPDSENFIQQLTHELDSLLKINFDSLLATNKKITLEQLDSEPLLIQDSWNEFVRINQLDKIFAPETMKLIKRIYYAGSGCTVRQLLLKSNLSTFHASCTSMIAELTSFQQLVELDMN